MVKRQFTKEELYAMDLPDCALEDEIYDTTRWSVLHEIIFEFEGKYYKTTYSQGATEMQCESPWEFEDLIDCYEVEKKQVLVEKWVAVK